MNAREALRPLERRVTLSYLTAFAFVLVVFVLAVHVAFAADAARATSQRLAALVDEGTSALEAKHGKLHVDGDALQLVAPLIESISYDDARGTLVHRVGSLDPQKPGVAIRSVAAPRLAIASGPVPSRVVAAVDLAESSRLVRRVDAGLGVGFVLALAMAGVGGRILANRAMARIVATMRTLRDFTADAAHELRGPLTALSSNAAASLRADIELAPAHRKRLETIADTAASMTRTVDDLLLIARAETPIERELFAVDLSERASHVVSLRRALASQRRVALDFHPFRARVYGNPAEIDRMVGNLVDNALRYTAAGGTVLVEGEAERGGFALRVRDTGIGIAAADHARIFERFWRADVVRDREGGTGLGLAIARALARRHGGDVFVKSELGTGSEFSIWLPLKPPQTGFHEISTFG